MNDMTDLKEDRAVRLRLTTHMNDDAVEAELATLAAQIDAATHRMLECIAEIDRRGVWDHQGARSCAQWLSWRLGLNLGAAREKVRVARALEELPAISDAFRCAKLSYSKVRALTRVATPDNELDLLDLAVFSTASQIERVVRAYRRGERLEDASQERARREHQQLVTFWDDDGMLVVQGRLSPEEGATLLAALDQAPQAPTRADALVGVARAALDGGFESESGGRPEVVVHVDAQVLADVSAEGRAHVEDGPGVSAETCRRIACDAGLVGMLHDAQGEVLNVGRRTRKISAGLRRALRERDGGCRFPGCTNHRWVDGHHLQHWVDGGTTELDNLVLLCRGHHRAVHEGGFGLERESGSGELVFRSRSGTVMTDAPVRQPVADDVGGWMNAWCAARGLRLDDESAYPKWDGTHYDAGAVADGIRVGAGWG